MSDPNEADSTASGSPLENHEDSSGEPSPTPDGSWGDRTGLLPLGPVVLAISVGVQWMIWLWRALWHRAVSEAQLERFTSLVRPMFQADNDKPIYLVGLAIGAIGAVMVYLLWRRRIREVQTQEEWQIVETCALLHWPAAAAVVLVPMLWVNGPWLNFSTAILGVAGLVLLHGVSRQPADALPRWPKLPAVWPWGLGVWVATGLVILLVYIPAAEFVSGWNYRLDSYTHWNGYAMFPALAYRNGGALITEHYAQYGVGWPLVLAGLSHFTPLSYAMAIRVGAVWGCIYYVILFLFLQTLLRRTSWAFAGLLLALYVQAFGGMIGSHKWALPSGTVLRCSVDMLFFLVCLCHARTARAWLGLPLGIVAGCGLLFGIDTGLYLTVCFLVYLVACPRLGSGAIGVQGAIGLALCAVPTMLATTVAGLWIATRGQMFRANFCAQWLESIFEYGGGISDLPIAGALHAAGSYFLLATILVCYLIAVMWMVQRLWSRQASAEDLITGLVALYGMAALLLFVGRSDPPYLRNVAIPFCVVLARLLLAAYRHLVDQAMTVVVPERQAGARETLEGLVWLTTPTLLIALFTTPEFTDYPGLLQTYLGNAWTGQKAEEDDYLFLSRRDAPLGEKRRDEVKGFRAVTAAMRELADQGQTVAMLDMDDTEYLVEADLRPYFRHSPVLQTVLTKAQVEAVKQRLIDDPPDYVVYPAESPLTLIKRTADDVYLDIRKVIRENFVLDKTVSGKDFWRKVADGRR